MIFMFATIFDAAFRSNEPPRGGSPPMTDLETTTDLHEEHTSDLGRAIPDAPTLGICVRQQRRAER